MTRNGSGTAPGTALQQAVEAVKSGMSQREASRRFKVCHKTIRRYLNNEPTVKSEKPKPLSGEEMAIIRAKKLSEDMNSLFVGSRYPVINPEAMHVVSAMINRRDRITGVNVPAEGAPRTWLSDTLRVAPVQNPRGRIFLFTGAQNDTPVHQPFWENLNAYAAYLNAEIVIGPWTYETNWWDENNPASRHYAPEIADHLCFGQMQIGSNFLFAGEMNTLPTAARPISDLSTYSQGKWAVFPHARIQLLSIPAANPAEQAFQIMTTGSVTIPQVIPRKAGIKSLSFHAIGATIVEFDSEGDLFCRQILATPDGAFQDLDIVVGNGRVFPGNSIEAVTAADIHIAKMGTRNALATFGFDYRSAKEQSGSLIGALKPDWVFLHDIHDHESRSHHHRDDVSHSFEMAIRDRESVKDEITRAVDFLEKIRHRVKNVGVVEANHDLALERYIREGRYRGDGVNHIFGLELDKAYHEWRGRVAEALDAETQPESFSLLEWAVRFISKVELSNVKWIYDGGSFILNGVQTGFHGHRGVNGAKGSVTGFAKTGHAITMGHSHSPQILDRVYCAGTMQLQHGYNKGASGWAVSHVLQYRNGHRALITLQNGKWRGVFS